MFNEFPYVNMHELNLDWIIKKVKEAYSPDNPPEGVVLSVNGQDGNVILYQDAIVRFPDVQDGTWNVHRIAGGASSGIQFTPTKAQRISGANRYDMYDSNNPPPYPVTSVNGQTGDVSIQIPVQSVNGQTGVVVIPPDFTSGDEIMEFTQESEGNYWGLSRTVSTGNASIYLDTSNNTVKAYISFNSTDGQTNVTYPLLTSADIPSSSGVISINAKTGAVTLYGTDIYTSENSQTTVAQDLASHGNSIASLQQTQTEDHTSLIQTRSQVTSLNGQVNTLSNTVSQHSTAISTNSQRITTETNRAVNAEQNIMESVAVLVSGSSSATGASVGQYVYVKGSTITGITDGLYKASQAIPANTSIDSSYLTAVSGGGLNSLNDSLTAYTDGIWTVRKYPDGTAECWGRKTYSQVTGQSLGGFYYHVTEQIPFPSSLFVSVPSVQANCSSWGSGLYWGSPRTPSAGALYMNVYSSNPGPNDLYVDILARGRWK